MTAPRLLVLFAAEEPEYARWVTRLAGRLEEQGARIEVRDVESWLSGLDEEEDSELDRIVVIGSPRLKRLCDRLGLSDRLGGVDRDRFVPVLGRAAWPDAVPDPLASIEGFDLTGGAGIEKESRALRRLLFPSRFEVPPKVRWDDDAFDLEEMDTGTGDGGEVERAGRESDDLGFDDEVSSPGGGGYGDGTRSRGRSGEYDAKPPPADPDEDQPWDPPPHFDAGPAFEAAPAPVPTPVQVTTVSPTAVEPGARFHVEVVFHVEGFDVEAEEGRRIDETVATLALREGAKLTVRLVSVDEGAFAIDDPEAPLVWGPPSRRVDFRLRAAKDLEAGVHDLRVESWCGEVQLARTYLEITVGRQPGSGADEPAVTRRPLPRSAFASYAHVDKAAVAGRVDSLKAVGIDVFLDSLDIRQGADWREVLERELLGRDSLLLFWSTAARASAWVEKEWRFALDRRGLDGIIPNALEPADACPPPKELASLQFGSVLTELVTSWRRDAAGGEPLL
jgi:hypothetical protein